MLHAPVLWGVFGMCSHHGRDPQRANFGTDGIDNTSYVDLLCKTFFTSRAALHPPLKGLLSAEIFAAKGARLIILAASFCLASESTGADFKLGSLFTYFDTRDANHRSGLGTPNEIAGEQPRH
jgi:hypothetical protein